MTPDQKANCINLGIFFFDLLDNGMLNVLVRIASTRRF